MYNRPFLSNKISLPDFVWGDGGHRLWIHAAYSAQMENFNVYISRGETGQDLAASNGKLEKQLPWTLQDIFSIFSHLCRPLCARLRRRFSRWSSECVSQRKKVVKLLPLMFFPQNFIAQIFIPICVFLSVISWRLIISGNNKKNYQILIHYPWSDHFESIENWV